MVTVKEGSGSRVHFLFRSKSVSNTDDDVPTTSSQTPLGPVKSFTYGTKALGGEGSSRSASVEFLEEEYTSLLHVAESTGAQPRLIQLLTAALESNVERNDLQERLTTSTVGSQHMLPTGKLTAFHGLRPPPISLQAYLERLAKYTKCSPVCFIMAIYYMDQLSQRDPGMLPTPLNIHRLLLAGVLLAAKLTDDHYFNNAFYGRVGGVSVQEVNRLELEMLKLLDFRLWVPWEDIRIILKQLLSGHLVIGQGESDRSSYGRKRRSMSGNSSEKRSQRRSSASSFGASTSVSASAYDAADEDDDDDY